MTKMVYEWRNGTAAHGCGAGLGAQVAGGELERIRSKHGVLSKATVLKEAKFKKSPLHNFFEWDDKKAADKHRLEQAGGLIRELRVKVITEDKKQRSVRAYVQATAPESEIASYHPIINVLNDDTMRLQLEKQCAADIKAFKEKYIGIKAVRDILQEMDIVLTGNFLAL